MYFLPFGVRGNDACRSGSPAPSLATSSNMSGLSITGRRSQCNKTEELLVALLYTVHAMAIISLDISRILYLLKFLVCGLMFLETFIDMSMDKYVFT